MCVALYYLLLFLIVFIATNCRRFLNVLHFDKHIIYWTVIQYSHIVSYARSFLCCSRSFEIDWTFFFPMSPMFIHLLSIAYGFFLLFFIRSLWYIINIFSISWQTREAQILTRQEHRILEKSFWYFKSSQLFFFLIFKALQLRVA